MAGILPPRVDNGNTSMHPGIGGGSGQPSALFGLKGGQNALSKQLNNNMSIQARQAQEAEQLGRVLQDIVTQEPRVGPDPYDTSRKVTEPFDFGATIRNFLGGDKAFGGVSAPQGQGLTNPQGSGFGELGNFFRDWWGGVTNPKNAGITDPKDQAEIAGYYSNPGSWLGKMNLPFMGQLGGSPAAADDTAVVPGGDPGAAGGGPTDYMTLFSQLLGQLGPNPNATWDKISAQDVNFDPQRQALQGNASAASQALQGIYSQLNRDLAESGKGIDARFDAATADVGQHRNEAAALTQSAATQASGQQADLMNQLGIQNEVARAVQDGRDLQGRGAAAVGNIAQTGQANQDFLSTVGASEGQFNGRLQQAGSAAGSRAQGTLQQQLANQLAQVAAAEQQAQMQADQQAQAANAEAQKAAQGGLMNPNDIASMAQWIVENQQGRQDAQSANDLKLGNSAYGKYSQFSQIAASPEFQALSKEQQDHIAKMFGG